MKKLFTMIRRGNLEEVAAILDKKPELISCLAKAPPKKDDGQSPLMVAIKSDNLEVGRELLDGLHGLDPDCSAFKPYTTKYRGKEQLITPSRTVETYRQEYEIKWRELDPTLRAYYQ